MMKRTVIFLLLGLLAATDVLAQNRIFGIVTDGNGEPLAGATVIVKERPALGAVTDVEGITNCGFPITGGIH